MLNPYDLQHVKYSNICIQGTMLNPYDLQHVKYSNICIQGTMLNPYDLQRVAVDRASAVLVLCNKFSPDPSKQ